MHLALLLAASAALLLPIYYALVAALAGLLTQPDPAPQSPLTQGITALVPFVREGPSLEATVAAFLTAEGDFPREVLLLGDAPDQASLAVAEELAQDSRVTLVLSARPLGKASQQAAGAAAARFPLLLCLDAGTVVASAAPRRLALPLLDPAIAYTTGRLTYTGERGLEAGYWDLEQLIKRYQSSTGGLLGATGGLFACRRGDYVPCPDWCMVDLVLPCLLERLTGGRGLYVESAIATEPRRLNVAAGLRARIRIQARAVASTGILRGWLAGVPLGRASRFLVHKFLRWYVSVSLTLILVLMALGPEPMRPLSHGLTGLLLLSGLVAVFRPQAPSLGPLAAPGYAVGAQSVGWLRAILGRSPRIWSP